jgi:hypothetical protein
MHATRLIIFFAALLVTGASAAAAPNQPQPPAPAKPYKPVTITRPTPITEESFEILRQQLVTAAKRKNRADLARLVVAQGFFWDRDKGNAADKRKSGVDNLAAALGLAKNDGAGWDLLANFADDPTASPSADHAGAICAPADPAFNGQEFDALLKATQTDANDWGYPVSAGLDVHATPQANAPVIDKLALNFVRVMPEATAAAPSYLRIVTPAGKIGFVTADSIAPLGNDQICYVKDGGGWKVGGYIGSGDQQ